MSHEEHKTIPEFQSASLADKIKLLLNSPVQPDSIAQLSFPSDDGFVPRDHLTYLEWARKADPYYQDRFSYGNTTDSPLISQLTETDTLAAHIHRRLGHIVVNPNDPFNTAALTNSYCYYEAEAPGAPPEPNIANWNEKTSDQFVDALIKIAKKQTQIHSSMTDTGGKGLVSSRTVILHGNRGTGKTFYQNFLLSKYSDYLDQQKIIWVRVNLVNECGYEGRLVDWINAQAAKIILRYYDSESLYFRKSRNCSVNVQQYFSQEQRGRSKKEQDRGAGALRKAKLIFQRGGLVETGIGDEEISDSNLPPEFSRLVVAAARRAGFHFIVILDGLDVLEITISYQDRFWKLLGEARILSNPNGKYAFALVIAMRTSTLMNIFRRTFQHTYEQTVGAEYVVYPVSLESILRARLKYLETEVAEIARVEGHDWELHNLTDHLSQFQNFLSEGEHLDDRETRFLETLQRVQGENARAKMQMIQYKYYEFIVKHLEKRLPYQAVEAMMKAGRRFPPIAYKYTDRNGALLRSIWHTQKYDSRFFPSVFRFPFVSGRAARARPESLSGDLKGVDLSYVLLGIRILQVLGRWSEILASEVYRRRDAIFVGELCRIIELFFGYTRNSCLKMLEEFSEYQLVEFSNPNLLVPSMERDDNEVQCLPKMSHILNNFLFDLAYLNMASMRIPLPDKAFITKEVPFIQAASYEDASDELSRWVLVKITNSVSLVRLICEINRNQEIRVKRALSGTELDPFWVSLIDSSEGVGPFCFVEKMKQRVLKQCEAALAGIHAPRAVEQISSSFERYASAWP